MVLFDDLFRSRPLYLLALSDIGRFLMKISAHFKSLFASLCEALIFKHYQLAFHKIVMLSLFEIGRIFCFVSEM